MPCFPNAGAFLLFLPVPFSSLCRSAANVTSSIAECTCNTQLKPALRMLFNSSRAICASNVETQWTGRCGAQSTKPGKMSSSSTPRIRMRTWSPQVAFGTSSSVSPYNAEMVMSSRLGCEHCQVSITTNYASRIYIRVIKGAKHRPWALGNGPSRMYIPSSDMYYPF